MSKIKEAFKNGKAFIPFITGGDPDLETTKKLIIEMQNAGADIIEYLFQTQSQKDRLFRRQI